MKENRINKGGRPRLKIKRAKQITVVCNLLEFKTIVHKAKLACVSKSEYLRNLGVTGQIVFNTHTMPKEALRLTAELNQTASLLNQIAKKRNRNETLGIKERMELKELVVKIKQTVDLIQC